MQLPNPLLQLIEHFSRFPGTGQKQAARFALYLLKKDARFVTALGEQIRQLKDSIDLCESCYFPIDRGKTVCGICADSSRDKGIICIVEKEIDILTVEKTRSFAGRYFILGNLIDFYDKETHNNPRFTSLSATIKKFKKEYPDKVVEVVLALSTNAEGINTVLVLEKLLKPLGVKITRPAQGLPKGAEMEYADPETLKSALEWRQSL